MTWTGFYERILLMEDDLVHWFVLYERILFVRINLYTVCTFNIVIEDDLVLYELDDLVHWFVLYERILLMRMTWYTGLYFMNEYC